MSSKMNSPNSQDGLRERAEEMARLNPDDISNLSPEEISRRLHELKVHQIELEMQNEELRRTQEELDASRARYFDLYDLAPVGYCTLSAKGLILEANLTAAALLDVPRGDLVNQPISKYILSEDQDTYYLQRRRLFETRKPQVCELRMVRVNSSPFWVRLDMTLAHEVTGSPVCRLVLSDITERKRAEEERERLQEHLRQAQKMESVGRLAGGVAHEFNNMLSVITGNAELGMGNLAQDDPLQETLREILTAASRSSEITRQLLSFARKQIISPQELVLNQTVEGMLKVLRRLLGMDVDLVWMPGDQLWPVKMDPTQLVQILTNLCLNARDAVSEGGRITVMTKNVTVSRADCSHQLGLEPGDFVLLTVSDNGCGMDRETLSNLFEPFFTTKEMDKGTGLGLATVHGIVKQNKGFIQVDSEPGEGSTFKIYLPRYRTSTAPAGTTGEPSTCKAQRTQTILVVDDEPAVLKMIHIMLEHLGYSVLTAEAPREAFRVAKSFSGTIDLILTDVIMPEMNGGEMAKQLQSLYPHLQCLFMSGYSTRVITDEGMLGPDVYFIQKPFAMKDLAHKIGQVLGNDAPADNQFVQAHSIS
jgi:PAS domain S-box-containing protein